MASPSPARELIKARLRKREERAFVIVFLALIMGALFLMAGFGVDLGYWYLRSAQIQRASDAAALAGSLDMPDTATAISDAMTSASKNGYTDGVNGVSVKVTPLNAGRIQVAISDPNVSTFFTAMILDKITIGRQSAAERLSAVPMGAPQNVLGSGSLDIGTFPKQEYWLAINGYCTPKEDGDYFNSGFDGNRVFKNNGTVTQTPNPAYADHTDCSGDPNDNYQSAGYDYTVTVPAHTSGTVEVDVYDPEFNGYCNSTDWWSSFPGDAGYPQPGSAGCSPNFPNGSSNFNVHYTLYDTNNSDSTTDDTIVPGTVAQVYGYSSNSSIIQHWIKLGNLPINSTGVPHKYRLNVSEPPEANSFGVNAFSIRAVRSWTSTTYCDIRANADCPEVSGDGAISVNADAVAVSGYDTFYLANIDASYAGETLTLNLWDPGEGFSDLRLIAPDGSVMPLKWSATPAVSLPVTNAGYAVDTSDDDPSCKKASWSAATTLCGQPGPNRYGTSKLNDRMVAITTQIPDDYAKYIQRASGSTWWSVQYEAASNHNASLHDRTTWQIQIGGQEPAHLVPLS